MQSIVLSADGQPIQTYQTSCNFTFARPCPLSTGPQAFTLPTTSLSDGTHTLTLTAIDAAGNRSTVASEQITIDNDPPSPPIDLTATPTQTGSTTFIVTWADPSSRVAPITSATYQICSANGQQPCSTPVAAPAEGPASVTVPGPGTWKLTVWLTNAAGNSDPANAADTTLTVPAPDAPGPGSSSRENPDTNGSSNGNSGAGQTASVTSKPAIRLSEALHGRKLVVHIVGPPTGGEVSVSYTVRYHNKTIAAATKMVKLKYGRLTVTFKLNVHAAVRTSIRVRAQLEHDPAVQSTLRGTCSTAH